MTSLEGMTMRGGYSGPEIFRFRILGSQPHVGVCVKGQDYFPGDELDAPMNVMAQIVALGKAEVVDPNEVRHDDPVVETRDPPRGRTRKGRRRA